MGDGPAQVDAAVIYRRLLGYARPHWRVLGVAIVTMVFYAITDTGFAALMKPLLDGSFVSRDIEVIRLIPPAIIVLFMVRGFAGFLSDYCMNWVSRKVIAALRREVFDHYLDLPASYYDKSSAGKLLSKLTYNIEQVADSATKTVTVMVRDSLTITGLVAWMLYLAPLLAAVIFVIAPLIGGLIVWLSRRFRRHSRRIQESMGDVTRVAEEMISAQRVIKVFNGQEYERKQFERVNEQNRKLHMRLVTATSGSEPVIMLVTALGVAGIIYVATLESMLNTISVGSFISFLSAMLLVMAPLKRLTNVNSGLQQGIAAAESIFELLDETLEDQGGSVVVDRVAGEVEYRHVNFGYDVQKGRVLSDVCLRVPAGDTVAFVGRSGSGKSTLVSLLPRFYQPDAGGIFVDGQDISEYDLRCLRDQISLVSQDITLFNDTIARNIAYGGMEGATRESIEAAAQTAHIMEFVEALPDGLDTLIGDRGMLLSGGQRQRVAIARAVLKNAPILIFDEATSALDTESERQIQAAVDELMRNRTTLVIAHRLSTVESADRIIVLAKGRIVENGTHQELLRRGGHYATLYRMQFNDAESVPAAQAAH